MVVSGYIWKLVIIIIFNLFVWEVVEFSGGSFRIFGVNICYMFNIIVYYRFILGVRGI